MECVLSSGEACEIGSVRWWLGPGIPLARAKPVLADALRQLEGGAVNLRHGRRKELYRLALADESREFLLKLNRYERGAGRLQRLRRSKARREMAVATALHDRGIATETAQPEPVAQDDHGIGAGSVIRGPEPTAQKGLSAEDRKMFSGYDPGVEHHRIAVPDQRTAGRRVARECVECP